MSAAFVAELFDTEVDFVGAFDASTQGIVLEASTSPIKVAGIEISGVGPNGVFDDGLDDGPAFRSVLTPMEQSLGFSGLVVLPGEDLSGQPAVASVSGTFAPNEADVTGTMENWLLAEGLIEIDQASLQLNSIDGLQADANAHVLGVPVELSGGLRGKR